MVRNVHLKINKLFLSQKQSFSLIHSLKLFVHKLCTKNMKQQQNI